MNIAWVVLVSVVVLALAYRLYGRRVARWLGEDQSCPTPSVLFRDDKDFVPTRPSILFGHHFATIAGAGPILGPTMAACYGYGPVWLWILGGGILFGAVHDYAALSVSLREEGRSMADVARRVLGKPGFLLFVLFTIIMLVLVTAAFLNAAAKSLTSAYPLEKLGVTPAETFLDTFTGADGVVYGQIGGIASTSVIIITALSPVVGYLIYRRNLPSWLAFVLTGAIAGGSIVVGFHWPVSVGETPWMLILTGYVWLASSIPVWVILQPRDFTNVQILYGGIVLLVVAIVAAGLQGATFERPAFSAEQLADGRAVAGSPWPMLFVLVACGAISGFHALVSTGTTSKQCWMIKHSRPVAFGGMLLESLLAACVLAAVVWGLSFVEYRDIVWPAGGGGNPVLAFAVGAGKLFHKGLGIPPGLGSVFGILLVEGFVVTTLDSSIRLNRYLFEELWTMLLGGRTPAFLKHSLFNSALAVVLMFVMCYFNAFQKIWPIFGAGNQLLAAMALLVVSLWLLRRARQAHFALVPAAFMTVTTLGALGYLFWTKYLPERNVALMIADVVLMLLAVAMVVLAVRAMWQRRAGAAPPPAP